MNDMLVIKLVTFRIQRLVVHEDKCFDVTKKCLLSMCDSKWYNINDKTLLINESNLKKCVILAYRNFYLINEFKIKLFNYTEI